MSNFLAATGRARPTRTMLDVLQGKLAVERGDRRERLVQSEIAESNERLEKERRINRLQAEQEAELNKELPVDSLMDMAEGGRESYMAKMLFESAKKRGMISESGTITQKDMLRMGQVIQTPQYALRMGQSRVDWYKEKYNESARMLAEKPGDQKLMQNTEELRKMYHGAIAMMPGVKALAEQELAAKKQANLRTPAEKDAAALDLYKKKEEYKRANETPKETPDEKLEREYNAFVKREEYKKKHKDPASTKDERYNTQLAKVLPKLEAAAEKDPFGLMKDGIRMTESGKVWTDPVRGLPKELPPFTDSLGKRGGPTALRAAGEQLNDAEQLIELLKDPEVAKELGKADGTLWDRSRGAFSNRIDAWMTKVGIAEDSKTATTLRRMQMMASGVRKEFLGSAVTGTELKTITGWLLDPGDSYSAMINKANLIGEESKQEFKDFIDSYRNNANMSFFYERYGIDPFPKMSKNKNTDSASDMSDEQILQELEKLTSGQ